MTKFRFVLIAVGLFGLTFVGVSWAQKGFPLMVTGIVPMKPDSRSRLPTFEESVKDGFRQEWENSKTSQSDGNVARDKLRLELLQASNAYAMSPCDDTIRSNFVTALTNYARAWYEMAHCRPGVDGCPRSEDDRFDAAAAAFRTPADIRVHEAVHDASQQGDLSRDDFPAQLRGHVFALVRSGIGEPQAACVAARQARYRR
jgi:hypothetical protein